MAEVKEVQSEEVKPLEDVSPTEQTVVPVEPLPPAKKPCPPWAKKEWKGPPGPPWKLFQGELTKEEQEIFKDCRKNAFYYRGLPLGIGAVLLTNYGAGRYPFIKRWSILLYPTAFFFGFAAGMGSYRRKCFKRIMALENSTVKERLKAMQKEYPTWIGKGEWCKSTEKKE